MERRFFMQHPRRLHIGTSGWDYLHWRSRFYPDELARDRWLTFYAQQFQTVEINHSFYQLPATETLMQWRSLVPDHFRFAVRASRYITHTKKLKDPHEPIARLMDRVVALEDYLGPILFQLPPRWRCNRDRTWHCNAVYDTLRCHGTSFCIFDLGQHVSAKAITADSIYIRLHGPKAKPYTGDYAGEAIASWAADIAS